MSCIESEARENLQVKETYGHCLSHILPRKGDPVVHWPTYSKLYQQLCDGVTLNKGTMFYWFDKKAKGNAYFLYAKSLSIAWIDDCRYWKWITAEYLGKKIAVAELIKVSWLDVRGQIKEYMLSAGITYEVFCHLKSKPCAYGWQVPILFGITFPNGENIEIIESLQGKQHDVWFTIKIGEFKVDNKHGCDSTKEYKFYMYNHDGHWKSGLFVAGYEVRPKSSCGC